MSKIENLVQLLAMVETVPEHNLDLDAWRDENKPPDCGSVACLGGWVPYWPYFAAMGVTADPDSGGPVLGHFYGMRLATELFGDVNMFDSSNGTHDTHKEEAIARVRRVLEERLTAKGYSNTEMGNGVWVKGNKMVVI